WRHPLDIDAAPAFKAGESAPDIFHSSPTRRSSDPATHEVSVSIAGTNDTPVISGTATGTVTEDEIPIASGTLTSSDADIGDSAAWSISGTDQRHYGALTVHQDRHWIYTLDNDAAQG